MWKECELIVQTSVCYVLSNDVLEHNDMFLYIDNKSKNFNLYKYSINLPMPDTDKYHTVKKVIATNLNISGIPYIDLDVVNFLMKSGSNILVEYTDNFYCPECGCIEYNDIPEHENIVECKNCGHPCDKPDSGNVPTVKISDNSINCKLCETTTNEKIMNFIKKCNDSNILNISLNTSEQIMEFYILLKDFIKK